MWIPCLQKICDGNKSQLRCLLLLSSFSLCVMLIWLGYVTRWSLPTTILLMASRGTGSDRPLRLECSDVLTKMTRGRWEQHKMTAAQEFDMKMFHVKVRLSHSLPMGLQRPDLECGNVTFGPYAPPMHPLLWYRALCDEHGATPCCFRNRCTNRSKEECACADCYDMRAQVQAEYSTWRPSERGCEVRRWPLEQICRVLDGATLYFIGDSFVRHVYTALLLEIRGDEISGGVANFAPPGVKGACSGILMFTEKFCRRWVDRTTVVCQGRTKVKFFEYVYVKQAPHIHEAVLELVNRTRSLVFLGIGIHDNFKDEETRSLVLEPLLRRLRNQTYPRLVWAATHAPGVMKTPRTAEQGPDSVRRYNAEIARFLRGYHVPVFDAYNLTEGVMSFDGAHYGLGVNRVKVRVLLTHIVELYLKQLW